MYCAKCGTQLENMAQFCPACGTQTKKPETPSKAFCFQCGKELSGGAFCPSCGAAVRPAAPPPPPPPPQAAYVPPAAPAREVNININQTPPAPAAPVYAAPAASGALNEISPKSRTVVTILSWFLGSLGVHRFYLGKIGTGIAMLFTAGGLGIWSLIDFIFAVAGKMRDKQGRMIKRW